MTYNICVTRKYSSKYYSYLPVPSLITIISKCIAFDTGLTLEN